VHVIKPLYPNVPGRHTCLIAGLILGSCPGEYEGTQLVLFAGGSKVLIFFVISGKHASVITTATNTQITEIPTALMFTILNLYIFFYYLHSKFGQIYMEPQHVFIGWKK
jgi:hypothetical protein